MDVWIVENSLPSRATDISLLQIIQTSSAAYAASYSMDTGVLSQG
jgi:hypothetical protein